MLWDMARYHNYDIRSPYNRDAALWVASQTAFMFPVDPRPLRDRRAAQGRIDPEQPDSGSGSKLPTPRNSPNGSLNTRPPKNSPNDGSDGPPPTNQPNGSSDPPRVNPDGDDSMPGRVRQFMNRYSGIFAKSLQPADPGGMPSAEEVEMLASFYGEAAAAERDCSCGS